MIRKLFSKKISSDYVIMLINKPITIGIGFLITYLITLQHGAYGYGLIILTMSFVKMLYGIMDVRVSEVIVKYFIQFKKDKRLDKVTGILWLGMGLLLLIGILTVVITFLISDWVALSIYKKPSLSMFFRIFAFTCIGYIPSTLLISISQIYGKFIIISLYQISYAICKLLLVYFFLDSIKGIIYSYVLADVIIAPILLFIAFRLVKKDIDDFSPIHIKKVIQKDIIHFCFFSFFSLTVKNIGREIDKIFISRMINVESVGIYKLAQQIIGVVAILSSPVSALIYPKVVSLWHAGKTKQYYLLLLKTSFSLFFITLIPSVILLIFSKKLVLYFWGEEFVLVANFIRIMIIGVFINNSFLSLVRSIFLSSNKTHYSTIGNIYTLMLTTGVFLMAHKFYGNLAPAITYSLTPTLFLVTFIFPIAYKLFKTTNPSISIKH